MTHWSSPLIDLPSKFRLRIGNEQIALGLGVTVIGRDAGCRITLLDTLVSRRHARIHCDQSSATIEDLGSRNGTRVNGGQTSGPHALREGDRISIGAHELVFQIGEDDFIADVPTGLISICAVCRNGYPATLGPCPRCGAARAVTHIPPRPDEPLRSRWSLGMLVEMLGKSMLTGRASEAEKLMREVSIVVDEQLRSGERIETEELKALTEVASWLAKQQRSDSWAMWMTGVHEQLEKLESRPSDS